ncbi:FMR1-interacting protein NUFIP1-like [Macrobrachium nipponense]|uniref:FMR1-interacting protein NUFIP1-like n=1 Tax=Macrobrachium nipponense TaxID=159736 RepID=UPI0030C8455B
MMQGSSYIMNECENMAGPPPGYHHGPSPEGTMNHQYYGQHASYQGYSSVVQNQWYQSGYGYTHNRKPLTCGPCNRTFYSQQRMDEHVKEHVDCPFPECKLSAHIKVIDQHINNQHMLINFEALQIDDETWIAERKKRFPTSQRAELRRAEQMAKLKRGEKLGVNKKPFNKDKGFRNKRGREGKQITNKDTKCQNAPSEVDSVTHNVDEKSSKSRDSIEAKKTGLRDGAERGKNNFGGNVEVKRAKFEDRRSKKRPRLENPPRPSIDVDLYESDEEALGVPPFKGTRHFYESVGEVNYFSLNNLSKNSPEKEFVISDDEEWEEEKKIDGKMVLGGALGTLMGAYSDSEDEVADEPNIKVNNKDFVATTEQMSEPKKVTENLVNQSSKEENSRARTKRRPRTHSKRSKKPINIQRRPRRRKPLLERLLQADIIHERNIILQCVRYIVENNFFDDKVIGKANIESGFQKGQSDSEISDSLKDKSHNTRNIPDNEVISSNDKLTNNLSEDQCLESRVLEQNDNIEGKSEIDNNSQHCKIAVSIASNDVSVLVKEELINDNKSPSHVSDVRKVSQTKM